MSICPYLAGWKFDPDIINNMSLALERVCEALGLRMRDDPATRVVAENIIKYADRGVRDATTLEAMVEDREMERRRIATQIVEELKMAGFSCQLSIPVIRPH
jgi:hypothetical protein